MVLSSLIKKIEVKSAVADGKQSMLDNADLVSSRIIHCRPGRLIGLRPSAATGTQGRPDVDILDLE
jgi:hypothetical protein